MSRGALAGRPGLGRAALGVLAGALGFAGCTCERAHRTGAVDVESLLAEMVDLEELSREPSPFYKAGASTSFNRESLEGGDHWFANGDYDHFVRTETVSGRTEDVLADLTGPGTITRLWTADGESTDRLRLYFDGEATPRVECTFADLFAGRVKPVGPELAYVQSGAGDLYFPFPYSRSLKVSREPDPGKEPARFYYQVGYRTYDPGTRVATYDPARADAQAALAREVAAALSHPSSGAPWTTGWVTGVLTIPPGESRRVSIRGSKTVYEWSARVLGAHDSRDTGDPMLPANAYRFVLLGMDFDGEPSVRVPLGDFFGSGPGVNPSETLMFTVEAGGKMTSRLRMSFRESMTLTLTNAGRVPYEVDLRLRVGKHDFTARDLHLRAEWGVVTADSWPPFDMHYLEATGGGKVVGSVYEIANPVIVWWGEGDQKIFVDDEAVPSIFGTGTEDDYGFAYGSTQLFAHPFHAQPRADGPKCGGLVAMNRMLVLDAVPYRRHVRYDEEVFHWIPCRPTFAHVVYWYAQPGTTGPREVDRASLAPLDLGRPEDMLSFEGEQLDHEVSGGRAAVEDLDNCSGAQHLVWRGARRGDRLTVRFTLPRGGRYLVKASLNQDADHGRQRFFVDGQPALADFDGYSRWLNFQLPTLGVFDLHEGDNTLEAEALDPNPAAAPGNALGLDYVVLTRQ